MIKNFQLLILQVLDNVELNEKIVIKKENTTNPNVK
jgi:hypothetical protein